jgi:hypothetical protein
MTTKVTLRRRQNLPKSSSVHPAMMKPGDVKSRKILNQKGSRFCQVLV